MKKTLLTIFMAILALLCFIGALIDHSFLAGLPGIILTTYCAIIIFDINNKDKNPALRSH